MPVTRTLQFWVFFINRYEKERLKSSVNWVETWSIKNLSFVNGILFAQIAFDGLRGNVIFFTSVSSAGLKKKEFTLTGGRKLWKLFPGYLIDDWMSLATLTRYY